MKKFLISAVAVLITAVSFASCYDPLSATNQNATAASSDAASADEAKTKSDKINPSDYEQTLDGLRDYMKDSGYITIEEENKNVTTMNAKLIGAEKGNKYTTGNIRVELYSFNLKKKNADRDKIIENVKKNGTYNIYNQTVTAYLSDSGKFLMIYSNSDIAKDDKTSDAYKTMQKAITAFKKF